MIVCSVQDCQRPNARSSSCNQHKRTVHQTGRSPPFPRLFSKAIARPVVPASVTPQPHFGCTPRLLFSWCTR
jgi:hypothetical protein